MRIVKIEIKNFKAFYGQYEIDLTSSGKNLLVYGENGSGKSSLFLALKLFLESAQQQHSFDDHKNIFVKMADEDKVRLHFQENEQAKVAIFEWSPTVYPPIELVVAKAQGFIDYKSLLEAHFVHREQREINIFRLLVDNILTNSINDVTQRSFGEDWKIVQANKLPTDLDNFNDGLKIKLSDLKDKVSEILEKFGYAMSVDFEFEGISYHQNDKTLVNQTVLLKVNLVDRKIEAPHHFLNEAKLSAIAISIYLASLLLQPKSELRILALDDVVIGLDMSNRLRILDILETYFVKEYQLFVMTYDKYWFELIKQWASNKIWKFIEMYPKRLDETDFEIPLIQENMSFIGMAEYHLKANDYKSAAVYIRTAFEKLLKTYCQAKKVQIAYKTSSGDYESEELWQAIVTRDKDEIGEKIIQEIKNYRKVVMNPLSHYDIEKPEFRAEIEQTIKAVGQLNHIFERLKKSELQKKNEELIKENADLKRQLKRKEALDPST